MKRIVIFLIIVTLLTGCSPRISSNKDAIDEEQNVFRDEGHQAILDIMPQEYMIEIPIEKIRDTSAYTDATGTVCAIRIDWETDISLKDAALMVSQKLGHDLVLDDETTWKSPGGTDSPRASVSVNRDSTGLEIQYYIDISQTEKGIKILTDNFPMAYFEFLPKDIGIENAINREVGYRKDFFPSWEYRLSWMFNLSEGQKITEKLFELYTEKENYSKDNENGRDRLTFTTNGNDSIFIESCVEENQVIILANYSYKEPGHMDSTLMKALMEDPEGSLLGDLPNNYRDILGKPIESMELSYAPQENALCYIISVPNTVDSQEIIEKAEQVFESEYTTDNKGRYCFESDELSASIQVNSDNIEMEFSKEAASDLILPYIHDIYPVDYEPELPDALNKAPFSMGTKYSSDDILFSKTWRMEEEEAKKAWNELQNSLKSLHAFSTEQRDGKHFMCCNIREYNYNCIMGDGKILIEFIYQKDK